MTADTPYIAPERLTNQEYSGTVSDIFSIGHILFMMVSKCNAFNRANSNDRYYKNFIINKPEKFWKIHCTNKGNDEFYSDDLKHLVNQLLIFKPEMRLSISEIKSHPWYEMNIPTQEEINTEMAERNEFIFEEEKNVLSDDIPQAEVDPSVFENNQVHRNISNEDSESGSPTIQRIQCGYNPTYR